MRGLTILEPWATLIAVGEKSYETRGWSTQYRGPLAIHAGKSLRYLDTYLGLPMFREVLAAHGVQGREDFHPGHVVAVAQLVDIVPTEEAKVTASDNELLFGDFSHGRFAWKLGEVVLLASPVRYQGAQGLWYFHGRPE